MSLSGQDAPLADVEQLRADLERLRALQQQLDIPLGQLRAAIALQTLVEVRELEAPGAPTPRAVGARAPTAIGTLKKFTFNAQAEAGTDIFSDDVQIDNDVAVLRTTVAIGSGGTNSVFSAALASGSQTSTVDFNDGSALTAGALFAFDLPVSSDVSVNYQFANDNTVAILVAQEIDTAGP